jgi:dihydropteroate synthase
MRAAVAAGAGMINDVYGCAAKARSMPPASLGVPVVLMHMLGEPRSMQEAPQYDDVVADVHRFLAERIFVAEMAGIAKARIVVDPGFGFGKNSAHNLACSHAWTRSSNSACRCWPACPASARSANSPGARIRMRAWRVRWPRT